MRRKVDCCGRKTQLPKVMTGTTTMPTGFATQTLGATSTVEYAGTAQTVSARTYGHLTLSGSGNKTLHNVVGQLGVLEGNGGDLRTGLPLQSVHNGQRFVHEPLRLNVVIAAPEASMDRILDQHPNVRDLVDNGWVHLHALRGDGALRRRRCPGKWLDVA